MHYRHELKYDITLAQYLEIRPRLKAVMRTDPHAAENGRYCIHSIYYDNYKDKALREKIDGVSVREKFRIRWYNNEFDQIKLEKKIKYNYLCGKLSTTIDREECRKILEGDHLWMRDDSRALIRELYLKQNSELIRPRVIVSYVREPYIYVPGNVRITFDSDVRSSLYNSLNDMFPVDIDARMEPGHMIMEVKYDDYLPEIIGMIIQTEGVRQTAFSKYGISRRFG